MPPSSHKRRRRVRVEYIGPTRPSLLPRPTRPGWWIAEFTGTVLPVVKQHGTGELIFPADTYGEDVTPVADVNKEGNLRIGFFEVIKVVELV